MYLKSNRIQKLLALIFLAVLIIMALWMYSYTRPLPVELPASFHGDTSRLFFFRGKWWTHLEGLYPFYRRVGDWILFAEHPTKQDWFLSTIDSRNGDVIRFKADYPGYLVFSFGFSNYFTEKTEKGIRVKYSEPDAELTVFLKPSDGSIIYENVHLPTPSDK